MKNDWEIDLADCLRGKRIAHIFGYVTNEFGEPTFKLTRFELDDGTILFIGGEHDLPYIEGDLNLPVEEGEEE